jgi:hypothetical protein
MQVTPFPGIFLMTFEGHIENGQIVLDQEAPLLDGMKVRVEILKNDATEQNGTKSTANELPSLYERMKSVAGKAKGLPEDYAINHDHYLHGQPKRQ